MKRYHMFLRYSYAGADDYIGALNDLAEVDDAARARVRESVRMVVYCPDETGALEETHFYTARETYGPWERGGVEGHDAARIFAEVMRGDAMISRRDTGKRRHRYDLSAGCWGQVNGVDWNAPLLAGGATFCPALGQKQYLCADERRGDLILIVSDKSTLILRYAYVAIADAAYLENRGLLCLTP